MRRGAKSKSSKTENEVEADSSPLKRASSTTSKGASSNPSKTASDANQQLHENPHDFSESEEAFEVESILASRVRHGKRQFLIHWKGFGSDDDTWEDEENVDSPDLIAAFLRGSPEDKALSKKTNSKKPKKPAQKRGSATSPSVTSPKKSKPADDSEDDQEWEVSKIVDYVELKDGTRQFLVRWKGFSDKEKTWEPESNLNCPELIQKFLDSLKQREENTRETREERRQVFKYNPELTKRQSHRSSTKKRISYADLE